MMNGIFVLLEELGIHWTQLNGGVYGNQRAQWGLNLKHLYLSQLEK